ncbi:MAG: bifunctional methionine sulfoxide reductase B/A protein [Candidatus Aminicenantes bacterium]|nr:MAG: bifunctional methionine sulfoxide reductase B/A protein [Candidatus Aminicenantes bacterium]
MMKYKLAYIISILVLLTGYCSLKNPSGQESQTKQPNNGEKRMIKKVEKTDEEWKKILTPTQYRIMRKSDTERRFSGEYNDHYESGLYLCAGCATPLFSSETKYEHGIGWPSFTAPINEHNIEFLEDNSLFIKRIEVRCAVCGAHLGHVFDDGPAPTYKHYCINSVSLNFKKDESDKSTERAETAIFAAGCFWGIEQNFRQIKVVLSTEVGYTGGHIKNPSYNQVCSDKTGHAEAVKITFNPAKISYKELLKVFFRIHDPTQLNRQGPDVGTQYRSAIFYLNKAQKEEAVKSLQNLEKSGQFSKNIVTEIVPASEFYRAEEYHQEYYEKMKKGNKSSCGTDSCNL